jgi:hypothetical protein
MATKQTNLRLDTELLAKYEALAEKDDRARAYHMRKALESYRLIQGKREGKPKCGVVKFIKPTVDEIRQYCFERNNDIDPDRFYDYCEANGWKLSNGNQMKDWKASIRTWEGRKREQQQKRESLIQRTERKAQAKVAAIEASQHSLGQDDHALWLQVDEHQR